MLFLGAGLHLGFGQVAPVTTGGSTPTPVVLPNGTSVVSPRDLPTLLRASITAMGGRMLSADSAQVVLNGTVTDGQGSRSAQITVQAPGYLAYREQQGHAITFDGSGMKVSASISAANGEKVFQSLLASFPDAVLLQIANGGTLHRIGSHFQATSGPAKTYVGPYWTLYAFSPVARPGMLAGQGLQQNLVIAVDEHTGFISEVRTVSNTNTLIRTQFSNWVQQNGQWVPGQISRLENDIQVLSFSTQQANVGVASSIATFEP